MSKIIIEGKAEKEEIMNSMKQIRMMNQSAGTVNISESTELGDVLKHLNDDTTDDVSKMSNIDMKTRLAFSELSSILAIDTLVGFSFLPERCLLFTRQKKRLAVSLAGKGRKEIVDISGGKREQDTKRGMFSFLPKGGDQKL